MGLYLGLFLYNILAAAVLIMASPFLAACCLLGDTKWRERCGAAPRSRGPAVWVHAASVGEVMMIRPLLSEIRERWPGHFIALSTMTGTGRAAAQAALGEGGRAFFLPLDFIWPQLRALARIRPSMVVVCETELWPNLLWLCRLKGIPAVLVNARLSRRSLPYYRALSFLFGPLLGRLPLIACQSEEDAARYSGLAGPEARVVVAGNLKYDGMARPPSPQARTDARAALGIGQDEIVLVAGSTREGEEELVLHAWQGAIQQSGNKTQNFKLVIAPRHPERFEKVASMLRDLGRDHARRSAGEPFSATRSLMLWDTMGELAEAYGAGDMAFVGGSLVPVGGHNPLEPAGMGLPVAFGPHMFNTAESAASLLQAGGALQAWSPDELRELLAGWLSSPEARLEAGRRALAAVEAGRGAARRTAEALARIMA